MTLFWMIFTLCLSIPLLVFGVGEGVAIATGRQTYSNWIRAKLGIEPKTNQRIWASSIFAGILLGFDIWFIPHIVYSIWPR